MISEIFRSGSDTSPAINDSAESGVCSYAELHGLVVECSEAMVRLPSPKLVIHLCPNSLGGIACYLGALDARAPLLLCDPNSSAKDLLIKQYSPTALLIPSHEATPSGFTLLGLIAGGRVALCVNSNESAYGIGPSPELALLLTTSGSTGSPKVVRLTLRNLKANAAAIVSYLAIGPDDTAILSLPMHYSYGLSLINSHLLAGGCIAITRHSFMRPEFWAFFEHGKCTSFAGVPYMYETLHRLRIQPAKRATLRTLTQAGGPLRPELVREYHKAAQAESKRLFVMYGQTEATARISYVPPEHLAAKAGSIGIAIPGGRLTLEAVLDSEHHELVYTGPNVMLGYGECAADLALGDVHRGRLKTGDLATMDPDGFFHIVGRLARFAKLFGRRIQLSDLEMHLEASYNLSAAVIEGVECLEVFLEGGSAKEEIEGKISLMHLLSVPPAAIKMRSLQSLPRTAAGKKDYKALRK